ncbi:MAG: GtrA family protein [Burkholderiales bacterium]|jgi:putative flippase GtrA|nr:GtrA family protein [Burkholderiales bacterium]
MMNLMKQGASYFVIGLIQLLFDWLTFVALSWFGVPVYMANIIGRIVGALLGFWLNGKLTFHILTGGMLSGKSLTRFLVLWILTTIISTLAVGFADSLKGLYLAWLIKPIIDTLLAVCGFLISKYWVYRK